jgi:hypothetical protein
MTESVLETIYFCRSRCPLHDPGDKKKHIALVGLRGWFRFLFWENPDTDPVRVDDRNSGIYRYEA